MRHEQKSFDLERVDRRNWIEQIQIPPFSWVNNRGRRVFVQQTSTMKLLLSVIESHCGQKPDRGWWLFVEEIAFEMSKSPRTACRAIADCEASKLLRVQRSFVPGARSHFAIQWDRIQEIIRANPETSHLVDMDQKKAADMGRENRAAVSESTKPTHDKLTSTQAKLASTHDTMTGVGSPHTVDSRTRGLTKKTPNKEPSWQDGEKKPFATYAGWPFRIDREHLRQSEAIQRLWRAALARNDVGVTEADRQRFFALARYVARLAALGEIVNAGGYFHAQIVRREGPNWLGEPCDMEAARAAIAYIDGKGARRQ